MAENKDTVVVEEEKERVENRRLSWRMMDSEQLERIKEAGDHAKQTPLSSVGVHSELIAVRKDDEQEDVSAKRRSVYKVSDLASKNVAELLAKDVEDESLRRYKEQLLGAAAHGDLGDSNDPRRVIVTEFRVVFEENVPDIVYQLDTEQGLAQLQQTGLLIKEGSNYKFCLKFRVQHEIVAGITFVNKVKKGIFSSADEIVIGSFAPQSQPHEFQFPRHGWNTAPKGMMYRGRYSATDRFIDSDGVVHLEYNYSIEITKNWR